MVNVKSMLCTSMLGFVFIGTALASPSGLNPTIEEILDATTHTELHAHSHNGPESNLSNAQRFAGGLPPARPASFQRAARAIRPEKERIQRRAGASNVPNTFVRGAIRVDNTDSGASLGYVSNQLTNFGEFGIFEPTALSTNVLSIKIPINVFSAGGTFQNLAPINAQGGFPLIGAVSGYANEDDDDLSSDSGNYAVFAEVNENPAQTSGETPGNSYTTITGNPESSQSAVWSYDPSTQALEITWTNSNNDPKFFVNPQAFYSDEAQTLGWTGNFQSFVNGVGSGSIRVTFTFVPQA